MLNLTIHSVQSVMNAIQRTGLAGPVFGSDLRVASRRRYSYALRFAYVVLLMGFIAIVWISAVAFQTSMVMSRAQMEVAAKTITMGIVGFQFFGAQLVTLVLMGTAISEEVYARTLAVLMTTPLSALQVVVSKFFSRLLQILLLVATSIPLLAIVRILGGIPWNYLLVSLCITLATVVFVGAVSLFFSALCRRAYVAVIASAASLGCIFALLPLAALVLLNDLLSARDVFASFLHWHPYLVLLRYTDFTISPRGPKPFVSVGQIVSSCTLLLAGAAILLAGSVRLVRSVSLRRAMGEPTFWTYLRRTDPETEPLERAPGAHKKTHIRRVIGPPMIWKELICSLSRRQRLAAYLAVGIEVMLLFVAYTFVAVMAVMGYEGTHLLYILAFLILAVLFTIVTSATLISTEKEARTWPLLLVTPLRDRDILAGKFAGLVRRCGPIWLPLVAYVVLFSLAGVFQPLAVPLILALSISMLFFLGCTGLYLSSRMRRTTAAVTAHLVLIGGLWLILPMGAFAVATLLDEMRWIHIRPDRAAEDLSRFVPFVQAFLLADPLLEGDVGQFKWAGLHGAWGLLSMVMIVATSYVLVGLLFVGRAVKAFRRMALNVQS